MKKKALIVVSAAVLALALAACGATGASGSSGASTAASGAGFWREEGRFSLHWAGARGILV